LVLYGGLKRCRFSAIQRFTAVAENIDGMVLNLTLRQHDAHADQELTLVA